MDKEYKYRKRQVTSRADKEFRLGEGRISSYASIFFGALSLLGVLAYLFPSYLTTTELRASYDSHILQQVLKYGMYFSVFFGIVAVVLNKKKHIAVIGLVLTLVAFLLGGYRVPVGSVDPQPLSLGVDWLILALLGSVLIFTTLEKLFPKYREQIILRDEWQLDFYYFCINHLLISAVILFGNYLASHFEWAVSESLQVSVQSCPIWMQTILILLCADFVLYWEHRIYHESSKLWKIHAVHHSVETMDWLAGSRGHLIQVFFERAMVIVPLYLLGVDKAAIDIYVVIAAVQAIVIHCNLGIPFGPIKYILVTPQFHHWHHSSEKPAIDTNYAAHTVLFDKLFNTYHMPDEHWPAEYGTTVRLPRTWWKQLMYPFSKSAK